MPVHVYALQSLGCLVDTLAAEQAVECGHRVGEHEIVARQADVVDDVGAHLQTDSHFAHTGDFFGFGDGVCRIAAVEETLVEICLLDFLDARNLGGGQHPLAVAESVDKIAFELLDGHVGVLAEVGHVLAHRSHPFALQFHRRRRYCLLHPLKVACKEQCAVHDALARHFVERVSAHLAPSDAYVVASRHRRVDTDVAQRRCKPLQERVEGGGYVLAASRCKTP